MPDVKIAAIDGGTKTLSSDEVEAFGASLRGAALMPGADGYDDARTVWNAMIDRKPALVARCMGTADVMRAVKFAAHHGIRISVKGAGHNIAGSAVADDAMLIDLSQMRAVHVDAKARTAIVQPGATLGDFDHEAQIFGLATPVGINSTTGISGLTLGGGFGWLSRKHGLTIDNLRAADVVTADGELKRASDADDSDLFWAIRGGGGNFGIVTSFEFDLHPCGPEVMSGLIVHPLSAGKELLQHYRSCVMDMSEDLNCWTVLRKAPPLPFLPPEVHGTEVIVLAAFYAGDMAKGEEEMKKLRSFGSPHADVISPHPYAGWQQAFDPLLTPGARNYWKSHNFTEMSDDLIDLAIEYTGSLPSDQCEIFFGRLGGAANRPASDATAYPHRDAQFVMNVHTRWEDAGQDETCVAWARKFHDATKKFATGGVYSNFVPEGDENAAVAYGSNFDRLKQLKKKYDPSNMFRVNININP